jgi:hypothetical protein
MQELSQELKTPLSVTAERGVFDNADSICVCDVDICRAGI